MEQDKTINIDEIQKTQSTSKETPQQEGTLKPKSKEKKSKEERDREIDEFNAKNKAEGKPYLEEIDGVKRMIYPQKQETKIPIISQAPLQDQYTVTSQTMINQLMIDKLTNKNMQQQYMPNSVVETAHVLLSNSASSEPLTEIDKEIKLANFTETEKFLMTQYAGAYQDMLWLMDQQKIREEEAKTIYGEFYDLGQYEQLVDRLTREQDPDNFYAVFDAPGTLRKTRSISTISRGYRGFERTKQVETINKSENITIDKSEQKPGFMDRMSGWRGNKQ